MRDNGVGFEVDKVLNTPGRSLGLFGMQERVELMGGTFHIDSRPGAGTRIHIVVPITKTEGGGKGRTHGKDKSAAGR